MPEVASAPVNVKGTERLYQPFESAGRVGAIPVTVGLVASYLSGNPRVAVFPAQSRQVPVTEAVSLSGLL
jgi:hypothetical protein